MQIGDLLKRRLEAYATEPIEVAVKREAKDYNKRWSKGVKYFVDVINKERVGTSYKPVTFIMIRQKLLPLREIDDLRWFYYQCQKYAKTKDPLTGEWNTFSKCFFGATKVK